MNTISLNSQVNLPHPGQPSLPRPEALSKRAEPPPISAGKGSQEQQQAQQAEEQARQAEARSKLYDQQNRYGLYQGTDQFYVQVLAAREGQVIDTKPFVNFLDLYKRLTDMTGQVVDRRL